MHAYRLLPFLPLSKHPVMPSWRCFPRQAPAQFNEGTKPEHCCGRLRPI